MLKPKEILTNLDEELSIDENLNEFVEQNKFLLKLIHKTLNQICIDKNAYFNEKEKFAQKYKLANYNFELGFYCGISSTLGSIDSNIPIPSIQQLNQLGCDY